MTISGYKSLYKELICILIITLGGCIQKEIVREKTIEVSTKYYVVKEPSSRDLQILEGKLRTQKDNDKYGILIGGYYLKKGENEKAKYYLEKYYNSKTDDDIILIMQNAWLGKIYKTIDKKKALKYFIEADKYKQSNDYPFTLNYFCKRKAKSFLSCYKEKIDKKAKNKTDIKQFDNNTVEKKIPTEKKEEIKIVKPLVIQVTQNTSKVLNGLLYSIEENKYNISLVNEEDEYDYIISDDYILYNDNKSIDFSIDISQMLDDASMDDKILNAKYVYIVIDEKNIKEGEYLKENLDLFQIDNKVVNFESGMLQDLYEANITIPELDNKTNDNESLVDNQTVEYIYDEDKIYPDNVTFIGVGDYDTIKKMIPYIRYISANPDTVNIVIVTDMIDRKLIDSDYYSYFKNTKIYTYINGISDKNAVDFQKGYFDYFGEEPEVNQYIGNDIISYLEGSDYYLTGIIEVDNNTVKRKGKCSIIKFKSAISCY